MAALIFLLLNLVASLFKAKSRLEAENAALRQQLTVLQRKVRGRVRFTNNDRLFLPARALAESWNARCGFDPVVEKRLVQAMIELDELDGAQVRLEIAMESAKAMDSQQARVELGEYQGQQGRIAKQRFVRSNNPDELARSIELYAAR